MHTSCGRREEHPKVFSNHWGWIHASTNWENTVKLEEIDLVDIVTPNFMHAPVAKAAIAAGKNVSCEKPIAGTLAEASEMVEAGRERPGQDVRLVQLPPLPGRRSGPQAGEGRRGRQDPPRPGVLPPRLGRRVDPPGLAVPEGRVPARAPTATSMPTSST